MAIGISKKRAIEILVVEAREISFDMLVSGYEAVKDPGAFAVD